MFKVNNKDTRTTPLASFWCLYCYFLTYSTPCSSVFVVNFEHAIASWVCAKFSGKIFDKWLVTTQKLLGIEKQKFQEFFDPD